MGDLDTIDYTVKEGRAEIIFDRPDKLNAITETLMEELNVAIEEALNDDSVYVIILSGRGRAFCAGADLDEMSEGGVGSDNKLASGEYLWKDLNACRLLWEGDKPTLAAINGPAVGGGFDFLLSCDLRVMSEDTFIRDGHTKVGMLPTFASYLLPRLIGLSKANEILLTGNNITAQEAEELGLVSELAPEDEIMEVAREWANELRDLPRLSIKHSKAMVGSQDSLDEALNDGFERRWECVQDSERNEAIDAFLDGRSPEFDREY
ncbi:enoyl-CoA hydratase/isomerase family protein [Halorarum salinum]|uniref:Enoyl-CoA hydratase/isomerase family protein n=1 Tax=Halorarum salinum TaxID=2743089 RepID=A0A7D5L8P9_9EURY|nr:enoyl-CoA hydratase/isomerase family protein [Halobaculum salinum]QLG60289.1 enoyl-CoA hydratase/isomerase family protein [Halobaculum salinum]